MLGISLLACQAGPPSENYSPAGAPAPSANYSAKSAPTLEAIRLQGNTSVRNKDYPEAMRRYRQAADMGDAGAMNNIGWLYQNGRGVPVDYAEALRWYRQAADLGAASTRCSTSACITRMVG